MPGLVPGIHVLGAAGKAVDGRDQPGHDDTLQTKAPAERPGLRTIVLFRRSSIVTLAE
jgi:hypothetical protein